MRHNHRYDFDFDSEDPKGRNNNRRAKGNNHRCMPCPTCHTPNRLTKAERNQGYQCNECADIEEGAY
jgi:hypothetical protein